MSSVFHNCLCCIVKDRHTNVYMHIFFSNLQVNAYKITHENYQSNVRHFKILCLFLLSQDGRFPPVVYWPTENGASKQFGTMIISNNISGVDRKNKKILFRELTLSVEDGDYVSLLCIHIFIIFSKNNSTFYNIPTILPIID